MDRSEIEATSESSFWEHELKHLSLMKIGLRRCSHCQELADLYTMLAQAKVALGDLVP